MASLLDEVIDAHADIGRIMATSTLRIAERFAAREWPPRRFRYLDPTWGQERMIAALAGVSEVDIGPFPG